MVTFIVFAFGISTSKSREVLKIMLGLSHINLSAHYCQCGWESERRKKEKEKMRERERERKRKKK